jgi:8-oxo-dGTP diphosphatase
MAAPQTPLLTTDCVIFNKDDAVLLIRRKHHPFAGFYALPGGFVDVGETVDSACIREVREETGLDVSDLILVGVYSRPGRDPRGHTASIAYMTRLTEPVMPKAGSDAAAVEWIAHWREVSLAFDHAEIVGDAEARLKQLHRN